MPLLAGLAGLTGLSGCALVPERLRPAAQEAAQARAPGSDTARPVPRPGADSPAGAAPSSDAVTVEQFDTTSAAERDAARGGEAPARAETRLGDTIASLGSPARPGFWLETPLVDAPAKGRVVSAESGESVLVDLIPLDAPEGTGSRISLPALRLLGVGLAGLHQLIVYKL